MWISKMLIGFTSFGILAVSVAPVEDLNVWERLGLGGALLYVLFHLMTKTVPKQLKEKDEAHTKERREKDEAHNETIKYHTDSWTASVGELKESNKEILSSIKESVEESSRLVSVLYGEASSRKRERGESE